jgi:putative phosphoesterase
LTWRVIRVTLARIDRAAKPRRAPRLTHTRETLLVRPDGRLRLALVADTHGHPHPDSRDLIAAQKPDRILHAGDIGDLAVLDRLAAIAPLTAIRGNVDVHADGARALSDAVTIDLRDGAGSLATLLLVHIALYGPLLRADVARRARAEHAGIVVCGHSHVPFVGRDKGVVVFNPGSIGPRRFELPIVFGVMDVNREGISMHHVSCETGARWEPGSSSPPGHR